MQIIRETISSCFASDLENDVTFTANCQLVHKPLPRLLGVLGPQQTQTMFWNQQIRPWLLYQLLGAPSWGGKLIQCALLGLLWDSITLDQLFLEDLSKHLATTCT